MSFRFYIVDLINANVKGTNDEKKAVYIANAEDYYVLDTKENLWLIDGTITDEIKEIE